MILLYNCMYRLYFMTYRWWKIKKINLMKLVYQANLVLFRKFLFGAFIKYIKKNKDIGITKKPRETKVIASLTTFPARIDQVWIAIETIMMQSVKADVIELWLAKEQFPHGVDGLPESLKKQMNRGLDIRFCDDLRSHKKYYYAMQAHPNDTVIVFDDDLFYSLDTIKRLMVMHSRNPQQAIGTSCCIFGKNDFYEPLKWNMATNSLENKWNLGICGGSATLFPHNTLHQNAFDQNAIRKICYLADDLWLTAMTYMNGVSISTVGRMPFPISVPNTQEDALTTINNNEESMINNNTQWQDIMDHYSQELSAWKKTLKITQ